MLNPLFDLNDPHGSLRGFGNLARLMDEVGHWFDDLGAGPDVNVYSNEEGAVVQLAVPGYRREDLNIDVEGEYLVISAEQNEVDGQPDDQAQVLRQEIPNGTFIRRIQLPFAVDDQHTEARYRDGILSIAVAKPHSERPRRIAISQ